jgi:hypothetical protein
MSIQKNSTRATRRSTITWMLTASSTIPFLNADTSPEEFSASDPKLNTPRKDLWDRTLNKSQFPLVATLADIILPSSDGKPSASDLHIPDFIDEWISAPYTLQQKDRLIILAGLKWIKKESRKRFKKGFTKLSEIHQAAICIDIGNPITANPIYESAAAFFLLFRKLTFGAYFTTEVGKKEIGETPLSTLELPAPREPAVPRKRTRVEKREPSERPNQDQKPNQKRKPNQDRKPNQERKPNFKPRAQRSNTGRK